MGDPDLKPLKTLLRDRSGTVMILFVHTASVMIAIIGSILDVGRSYDGLKRVDRANRGRRVYRNDPSDPGIQSNLAILDHCAATPCAPHDSAGASAACAPMETQT